MGGVAFPVPESSRGMLHELLRRVALGRAAQMQLDGFVQSFAIEKGMPPDTPARIVGDDILLFPPMGKGDEERNPSSNPPGAESAEPAGFGG